MRRATINRSSVINGSVVGSAIGLALALLIAPAAAVAQSGGTARWDFSASNELIFDHYGISGDTSVSPYRFPGNFLTDRFAFTMEREDLRGRTLKVGVELTGSNSPYLAQDGFVAQLLKFELEDGSMAVPYRVGAGDVVADFSRRVLQTSIKGVGFEMQPLARTMNQSIMVVSGSGARSWDDTFNGDGSSLYYNGASYLWASASGNSMLVGNFLNTRQTLTAATGENRVDRNDNVGSVYAETNLAGFSIEGEVAFLSGTLQQEDVGSQSFYAQLSRNGGPFSWRVRYEDNGAEYRPIGAVGVIPDRRIGEFHGRYTLGRRGTVRGRVQLIESRYESADPERTDLAGFSYDGRLLGSRPTLQLRVSGDFNSTRSESGLFDRFFQSWGLDVRDRIPWQLRVGYRLGYRDTEDNISGLASRTFTDHTFTLGRAFSAAIGGDGLRFDLEGGLIFRNQKQVSDFDAFSPLIDFSAVSRRHRVGLHLSFLDQNYVLATVDDLSYQTRRLTYSFTYDRHVLGFELGQELRRLSMGEGTDSLRATFRYRLSLGGGR